MLRKYKWIWIGALIVVVAGLIVVTFLRSRASNDSDQADLGETAVAFIGDLAESATATGQVQAQREAALSLGASGIVEQVNVEIGDSVEQGDVLVQLELASLQRAVESAQQGVVIAEADLSRLLAGPNAADLAAAEAAVSSAAAKLEHLLAGPTTEEIAASEASVRAAQANVWSASGKLQDVNTVSEADILAAEKELQEAQDAWQDVHNIWVILADCEVNDQGVHECQPRENSERMDSITEQVQSAQAELDIKQAQLDALLAPEAGTVTSSQAAISSASAQLDAAQARHEAILAGASDAEIASAQADLATAEANLEDLKMGPTPAELKIAETSLAQAQTALKEAENALADAALVAPFAGIVTRVYVSVGEVASGLAVDLFDRSSLEVILKVDEIDVGQLAVGQPAKITMETWPDNEIDSEITAIAPSPSPDDSGLVTYNVHLALEQTELPILAGMTANADLITKVGRGVLLVPNAAVTADREQGTYSVNLVQTAADGSKTVLPVEVTIGLRDDDFTQILNGVEEGDEVILGTFEAPLQRFGSGNGGGRSGPGF